MNHWPIPGVSTYKVKRCCGDPCWCGKCMTCGEVLTKHAFTEEEALAEATEAKRRLDVRRHQCPLKDYDLTLLDGPGVEV